MAVNFMPGEDDWMRLIAGNHGQGPMAPPALPGMGPQTMQAPQPQLQGQPQQTGWRGLLGNRDLSLALLANSGYGPKQSFGQVLGKSALMADQMGQQRQDDAFKRQYMQAQMAAMGQRQQQGPSSVQEYEYAKQNGYKGSFQEWTVAAGQSSRPSSVLEWEHYNGLLDGDKKNGTKNAQLYLEMKRNPNFKVAEIGGGQNVITGLPGGGVQTTQLSTPQQEVAFAAQKKGAESQAGAIGAGLGGNVADINTKASDAQSMMGAIQKAGGLIDQSTGSWVGSLIDKGAATFGKSTEGATAGASLKVLQASLLSFVPKMSGPQSDADRLVYIEAVGQIADTTVPRETRKAALQTVTDMQKQYMDRAKQPGQQMQILGPQSTTPAQPTRRKYNPATGKIE